MKRNLVWGLAIALLVFSPVSCAPRQAIKKPVSRAPAVQAAKPRPRGFAVLEFYTSEGCSSCIPADQVAARISKNYAGERVYVLGFHVNYWDHLGWKDPYSQPGFGERQQLYDRKFTSSVYTPQLVINGSYHFPGYQEARIRDLISQELSVPQASGLDLKASIHDGIVAVDFRYPSFRKGQQVQIALVQKDRSNLIKGGENNGKMVQEVEIVRQFMTLGGGEDRLDLKAPKGIPASDLAVVGLVQDMGTLGIIDATSCPVPGS